MAQWVGYMVSVKCIGDIGTYQGEIVSATNKQIILTKAFCNGFPCEENEVKIWAKYIGEIKLIEKLSDVSAEQSTVTIAKPIPKRAGRTNSETNAASNKTPSTSMQYNNNTRSKPIDIEVKQNNEQGSSSYKNNTPNKREKNKAKWTKGWKDEECFGSPLDRNISQDFDFEKNLALFNKRALWDELNSQKPDVVRHADNKRPSKYRHDENVIATIPTTYRQITVPKQDFCEYVTDDGLIIPSISRSLRRKLFETADRLGLTFERRVELLGRAAAEISMQLLGGGHRLNPHNTHQWPTVVVLCGPHKQGAVGVNAARQLASHGVCTIVFTVADSPIIKKELSLYTLSKNRLINNVSDLPNISDLIIVALCEDIDHPKQYPLLSDWVNKSRAPVLALDPPTVGTPGITPKFSLLPVLPLPHSSNNGKLYLCNLGFPVDVFNEVGIKYKSPFGPKFVIPLHPKDD